MSTELNSSNNVDVSTSAQLLPMQCCVQYGDCLTHLSNMDDNEVSYTITSPPYNVGTVKENEELEDDWKGLTEYVLSICKQKNIL